jgi:hypothetical protein
LARTGTPAFTALALHSDSEWRFEFWYPAEWQRLAFAGDRQGVIYTPEGDPATSFSIEVKDIGVAVTGQDLPTLREGFLEGLRLLPGIHILHEETWSAAALQGLEAKYTFEEDGVTRQRWVRLLYEGTRQFHCVAQGADPDEYRFWEPMLYETMATIRIH